MTNKTTAPRSPERCVCGHTKEEHEVGGERPCMKVDLNAGGRFIHRFCNCPAWRPSGPGKGDQ